MAVTQRGVRQVVKQWKNQRNSDYRQRVGVFRREKNEDTKKCAERLRVIERQYKIEPQRIGLAKRSQWGCRAQPKVHESLRNEPHLDARMSRNKCHGFSFFFFHEGGLAQVQISQDFAVLRDCGGPKPVLLVVVFV